MKNMDAGVKAKSYNLLFICKPEMTAAVAVNTIADRIARYENREYPEGYCLTRDIVRSKIELIATHPDNYFLELNMNLYIETKNQLRYLPGIVFSYHEIKKAPVRVANRREQSKTHNGYQIKKYYLRKQEVYQDAEI